MSNNQSDIALKVDKINTELTQLLADLLAQVMGMLDKREGTFEPHNVEPNSFELSYNDVLFDGGSYHIVNGEIIVSSRTPQINLGSPHNAAIFKANVEKLLNE